MRSLERIAIALSMVVALAAPGQYVRAQGSSEPLIISGLDSQGRMRLTPGKSAVVTTRRPQKTIKVGDPTIVDVDGISPTRILATAKKTGTTQIIVWDDQDNSQSVDVIVTADIEGLREQLKRLFPQARLEATASEDSIILSGTISSLSAAEQAAAIAAPYGKSVINLIEVTGNQQVMLQVRIAEVSRNAITALGVNGAYASGSFFGGSNVGQINPTALLPGEGAVVGGTPTPDSLVLTADQTVSPAVTLYGGGQIGSFFLEYFLSALRENNLLRILAEPNLVAISGQEASFLAGGEFPIPVPQGGTLGSTTITIEFKEFGVRLRFVPVVLGDGRIRLKMSPEVSDLDFTTAVRFSGFVVPGLRQRRVTTVVEMMDGQSLAIAGLLNQSIAAQKSVIPGLGDLPVLGALFRSVRYEKKETELVVLVTPRLVSAVPSNRVGPLPGEYWRDPNEFDLFFKMDIGEPLDATATTQPVVDRRRSARNFAGSYGFAPAAPEGPQTAPQASE